MTYQFRILECFNDQLKPFLKKFPRFRDDLIESLKSFNKESAIALGNGTYKYRIRSSDLKKGKSGSFRCIVYVLELELLLVPIAIYFKSDHENFSREEVKYALRKAIVEMNEW